MQDQNIARPLGLVTLATAAGAVALGYYAFKYFRPTYGATLPTAAGVLGGAVVGGYSAGTLAGLVAR